MTVATTRSDFERLAVLRISEAKALIEQGHWDGAYYLSGYAVECALKVRIVAALIRSESCPSQKFVQNFYNHNLGWLREAAGLNDDMDNDPDLRVKWAVVRDWTEQSRYQSGRTEREARELFSAIEDEVLPWIKARW